MYIHNVNRHWGDYCATYKGNSSMAPLIVVIQVPTRARSEPIII